MNITYLFFSCFPIFGSVSNCSFSGFSSKPLQTHYFLIFLKLEFTIFRDLYYFKVSESSIQACRTMAPPDFVRSVNPISTMGGRLCPPNNTGTSGFSDLRTALHNDVFNNDYLSTYNEKVSKVKSFCDTRKKADESN